MIRFKTDAIILKDAVCEARYAICRRFCPRAIYPYWREIWLERVPQDAGQGNLRYTGKERSILSESRRRQAISRKTRPMPALAGRRCTAA